MRYNVAMLSRYSPKFLVIATTIVTVFLTGLMYVTGATNNVSNYKDTISNSNPTSGSNHTFSFIIKTDLSPGSSFEITTPAEFTVINDVTFSPDRNVEMLVNGVPRSSSSTLSGVFDQVEIFPGTPGMIRYTLNTITGITSGSQIELKIGNHTSKRELGYEVYDELLLATSTIPADVPPIINASTTGTYKMEMKIFDGVEVAAADFLIALVGQVGVGPADTRETIPPERSNGAPAGIISGLSLFVEISLETDEFSNCRYSLLPDTPYALMGTNFDNTGLIFHTAVVPVVVDATSTFYVRCMDDEFNVNIDDYLIEFYVAASPSGVSNTDGEVEGDGTGGGNDGSGSGSQSGGITGGGSGEAPVQGGASGSGGSGGGGGGGASGGAGGGGGGGFESVPGPFESGDARVIISGLASPGARVFLLVDGFEAGDRVAASNGTYELTVDGIARGAYTFGIYAIDRAGTKTSTFSTSFTVSGARASALSNINIPPSVKVTPNPATPGQPVNLSGYAFPNAVITIEHEKEGSAGTKKTFNATANSSGLWQTQIETTGLANGTYKLRTKGEVGVSKTNFSTYTTYGLGQTATPTLNSDLNTDGKVNLTDFSILLFWWGTAGGNSNPSADINGDSRVNLTDFSILLFNWTG